MSRNVYIARHGHREDFIGDTEQYNFDFAMHSPRKYDPALSKRGISQANYLAKRLENSDIQHIFSSPFRRTVETASYVAKQLGLPVKVEEGFSEWLNPEWFPERPELLTTEQLTLRFPGLIDSGYQSIQPAVYPEWSEPTHVWTRTKGVTYSLLNMFEGDLLIVGHAASVIGVAFALAGEPVDIQTNLCGLIQFRAAAKKWELVLDGSYACCA